MNDIEFIKLAYTKGKVQDVSQALEDYPIEKEYLGKIMNRYCIKL